MRLLRCSGSTENQDVVEQFNGIATLVSLLSPELSDGVRAEAAAALAVLANDNKKNQDKVATRAVFEGNCTASGQRVREGKRGSCSCALVACKQALQQSGGCR